MAIVGLVPRIAKAAAADLAREMSRWLAARGHEPLVEADAGVDSVPVAPGPELAARADLIVVLGGDGTLIHAAGLCGKREVPILGVNMGTLGFLTEVPRERAFELLGKALKGELQVSRRLMLEVEIHHGDEVLLTGAALNDAVISKNAVSRLAMLEVWVDGKAAATYEADGVIVATPTGSTAYSLSANGPILYPTVETLLLTPICAHVLTQRPVVLPANMPIRIRLSSPSDMFVTLDGTTGRPLELGQEVWVRAASHRTLLLRNPEIDPFGILRQKLRWGAR